MMSVVRRLLAAATASADVSEQLGPGDIAIMAVCSQYWVRDMAGRLENVAASYERIPSGQLPMPGREASLPF